MNLKMKLLFQILTSYFLGNEEDKVTNSMIVENDEE